MTDDRPRCACWCGCTYEVVGKSSIAIKRCFSCRADVHFGHAAVPPTPEPVQLRCSACGQPLQEEPA